MSKFFLVSLACFALLGVSLSIRATDLFELHKLTTIPSKAPFKIRPHPVHTGPRSKSRITVEGCDLRQLKSCQTRGFVTLLGPDYFPLFFIQAHSSLPTPTSAELPTNTPITRSEVIRMDTKGLDKSGLKYSADTVPTPTTKIFNVSTLKGSKLSFHFKYPYLTRL